MARNGFLPQLHHHQFHVHKLPDTKSAATRAVNPNEEMEWHRPNHFSIYVYKNGNEYDPGTKIGVTRIQMPHWISLLDHLTDRLNLVDGSVQHIYTLDGQEIRHFRHFENNGRYVAAHGRFRQRNYGGHKAKKPPFGVQTALYEDNNDVGRLGIYSDEGLRNYLRQRDFEPTLGDIWDNSHFDLKGRRDPRLTESEEEAISNELRQIRNDARSANKSIGDRQYSRETRTEDLATTMMTRLSRSQSVNNVARQRPPAYEEGQSNSAEAELVKEKRKSGKAARLIKTESEQNFRAASKHGNWLPNRSRTQKVDARYKNAGRTPGIARNGVNGAASPGRRVYDEGGATYDIYEMSEEDRLAKARAARGARSTKASAAAGRASMGGRAKSTSNSRSKTKTEEEAEVLMGEAEEEVIDRVMDDTGVTREEAEQAVAEAEVNLALDKGAFLPLPAPAADEEPQALFPPEDRGDEEQQSPRWATELTSAVRELASEVHHLHPPLTTETVRNFRTTTGKSKK